MHGGVVEARSEGAGRGSEFSVRLPLLTDGQSPSPRAATSAALGAAKWRILVVDDNQDAAASLGAMLTLMGQEVRIVHDGLAALEEAQAFRPELILLDIGLPSLNGYDVCRRLRAQPWGQALVVVALTGWGQEDDRRRSREAGFNHHLVKPVEVDELAKWLGARAAHG